MCVYAAENRLSIKDQSSQPLTNGLIKQIICLQKSAGKFLFYFFIQNRSVYVFMLKQYRSVGVNLVCLWELISAIISDVVADE